MWKDEEKKKKNSKSSEPQEVFDVFCGDR